MSVFSWDLPSPPALAPEPGTAAERLLATVQTLHGPLLDLVIDPVTLDYVDTEDGDWLETADSRTLVMILISMDLDGDYFEPDDGTRIRKLLEEGRPVLDEEIVAEVRRALSIAADAGVITDVTISHQRAGGELAIECNWRDLAAGSPVDLVYRPYAET